MRRIVKTLIGASTLLGMLVSCSTIPSTSSSSGGNNVTSSSGTATTGDVINIWCWNNEFQTRFNAYYPGIKSIDGNTTYLNSGKKVVFTIHANDNNGYQIPLDAALAAQDKAAANDKIDMFLMEADYAIKYVNSDYTLDVKNDVGLTDDDLSQMYDYTKTIATDSETGALKGVSWQATPGLYAFRSDVAAKIWSDYPADPLSTDDAATKAEKTQAQSDFVQSKISTWEGFDAAAAAAKAQGFKIVSGYDDMYRPFSNNATESWVNDEGEVTVDPQIKNWVKKEKSYIDSGYSGSSQLWDTQWAADQGPSGSVFGFFYSTWGINFTLEGNSLATSTSDGGKEELGNGLYGLYRVCRGPASYYWGGSWLAACKGSDNIPEVKDIMEKLTCDKDIAKQITLDTQDYTNNKAAMNEIANDSDYGSSFLGGQNHIKLFAEAANDIKLAAMSAYDQGCNENFQSAMHDYFSGTVATYEQAYENFETQLAAVYPDVTFDSAANETL